MTIHWLWWVVIGVIIVEIAAFFGRYCLKKTGAGGMRPTVEWEKRRIGLHHGILGALLIAAYLVSLLPETVRFWGLLVVGLILIVSDIIHHCLLKFISGCWDPAKPNAKRQQISR